MHIFSYEKKEGCARGPGVEGNRGGLTDNAGYMGQQKRFNIRGRKGLEKRRVWVLIIQTLHDPVLGQTREGEGSKKVDLRIKL